MKRHHIAWAVPMTGFFLTSLVFLSLSRGLLVIWQADRVLAVDGLWYILIQGFRFDVVFLAEILIIPIVFIPILSLYHRSKQLAQILARYYFLAFGATLIFLELATPNFISQYDFRPNILMVEYLTYPKEVFSMLLKAVPMQLLLAIVTTGLLSLMLMKLLRRLEDKTYQSIWWSTPLLVILGLSVCLGLARSTLGHRAVNPSTVAFSSDPLMNSLPLSSGYSVAYALYERAKHETKDTKPYGNLPAEEVLTEIYKGMNLDPSNFTHPGIPTLHHQVASGKNQKNLVIILEESLGADFVGKLGGTNTTPNLDRLADEGMWFEQLYATGTRSVRGIEAVVTGFLPTPARSIVKLGGSQNNFFTVAQLLAQKGYKTSFMYGGEAHFDNMKLFFVNNGFKKIIEEKDFDNPIFTGSWGVSDEDLFNKAHHEFTQLSDAGEPFFSLVFTSSNHSPFDFPDGRIGLDGTQKHTVFNAVKYADFALGDFLSKAKLSNYWKDTVFLIIADHSDKVHGDELVPIDKYRIPGLILGEDIEPKIVARITSQIDMLPTLVSLIGVDSIHPAIGLDLTRQDISDIPGRAIMQFAGAQAYMEGEDIVILQKQHEALQFKYLENKLSPVLLNLDLLRKAKGHALWTMGAYREKAYRLP